MPALRHCCVSLVIVAIMSDDIVSAREASRGQWSSARRISQRRRGCIGCATTARLHPTGHLAACGIARAIGGSSEAGLTPDDIAARSGGALSDGTAKRGMRALIERGHIRARWDREAWMVHLVERVGTGADRRAGGAGDGERRDC
ncbi:hypothetical protein [Bradyrhizobium sp. McL0616]|uniref:hypothetical protein n=1 Tax=Bradyrhizobium sp. McL0616 TaxID=3415674 RepID=UPI003CE9CDD6